MRFAIALGLLLFVPLQDDAKIKDLILQLDSANVEEREEAYNALVKIGPPAVAALQKAADTSESAEVRTRAQDAMRAIDLNEKSKVVFTEPKRVTLDHDGTVRAALEEIAKQAGVKIDVGDAAVDAKAALKLADATLFEALDRLCAGREDCTWEHADAGAVKMRKEKHLTCPTAYAGPFRLRITSLGVERRTDFKAPTAQLSFGVECDFERYLKPMGRPVITFTGVTDDAGRAVEVKSLDAEFGNMWGGVNGARIMRVVVNGGAATEPANLYAGALSPEAKSIATLKGSMTVRFPLASKDIVFDDPAIKDSKEIGEYTVRIKGRHKEGYVLAFTKGKDEGAESLMEELEKRFDAASVVVIDKEGKEIKAETVAPQNDGMQIVVNGNGQVVQKGGLTYRVSFPDFKGKEIKSLKFKFVDQTLEKKIEFELKDIKLP